MLIGPKCSFFLDIWDIKRSLSRCSDWSSEMKTDLEICPNYYFLLNASPISGETREIRKPAWNVIGVKMRFRGCKETGLSFNPRRGVCTGTKKLFLRLCVQNNVISSLWSKFCLKAARSKTAFQWPNIYIRNWSPNRADNLKFFSYFAHVTCFSNIMQSMAYFCCRQSDFPQGKKEIRLSSFKSLIQEFKRNVLRRPKGLKCLKSGWYEVGTWPTCRDCWRNLWMWKFWSGSESTYLVKM